MRNHFNRNFFIDAKANFYLRSCTVFSVCFFPEFLLYQRKNY